jgi:hypothetical protein
MTTEKTFAKLRVPLVYVYNLRSGEKEEQIIRAAYEEIDIDGLDEKYLDIVPKPNRAYLATLLRDGSEHGPVEERFDGNLSRDDFEIGPLDIFTHKDEYSIEGRKVRGGRRDVMNELTGK